MICLISSNVRQPKLLNQSLKHLGYAHLMPTINVDPITTAAAQTNSKPKGQVTNLNFTTAFNLCHNGEIQSLLFERLLRSDRTEGENIKAFDVPEPLTTILPRLELGFYIRNRGSSNLYPPWWASAKIMIRGFRLEYHLPLTPVYCK